MTSFPSQLLRGFETLEKTALRGLSFRSRMFDTPEGAVHILDVPGRSDGPPVLLFHGLGSCALDWARTMLRLRRISSHITAIDLPGHGFSDTPPSGMHREPMQTAVISALDQVITEPHVVVGNSLGGLAAVRYAGARPERISALVLSSPGGTPMEEDTLQEFMARFDFSRRADAVRFVNEFLAGRPGYHPLLLFGLRARMGRPSIRALLNNASKDNLVSPEELSSLEMPVLLFWGADDHLLPPDHLPFYQTHLPDHTVVLTPEGYGHAPFMDNVGGFVQFIEDFLADQLPVEATSQ